MKICTDGRSGIASFGSLYTARLEGRLTPRADTRALFSFYSSFPAHVVFAGMDSFLLDFSTRTQLHFFCSLFLLHLPRVYFIISLHDM